MASANGHPGLAYSSMSGLNRTGFQQQQQHALATSSKTPQHMSQHATAGYQPQTYTQPQPPQTPQYAQHIFQTPSVQNMAAVQQNARPATQTTTPVPVPSRRSTHRQIASQPNNTLSYLQQSMNQSTLNQHALVQQQMVPQQNDLAPIGQQPMSRSHTTATSAAMTQSPLQAMHHASLSLQNAHLSQLQQMPPPQQQQQPQTLAYAPTTQLQQESSPQLQAGEDDELMEVDMPDGEADTNGLSVSRKRPRTSEAQTSSYRPPTPKGQPMSAPPEGGLYATLDEVRKFVMEYCTSVGYAIVIGRSKKTVPGLKKVLFVCDRAGKPPKKVEEETRKRKTNSRKCDCEFGFFAIELRKGWTVRYRPDEKHLMHNHPPSESPLVHPAARKLDSTMVAAVKQLKEQGTNVQDTLKILQQEHPGVPLISRDIYNARAALVRNPQKATEELAQDRPAIYSNKAQPTTEERIRADIRKELVKEKEEHEKLKASSSARIAELEKTVEEMKKKIAEYQGVMAMIRQSVPTIPD